MAIESAADLVEILAEEFRRSGADLLQFSEKAGISEDRLRLLQRGEWQDLTIREIAVITQILEIDFFKL